MLAQALAPDGGSCVCGTGRGKLARYSLGRDDQGWPALAAEGRAELVLKGGSHSEAVDCIVSAAGSRVHGQAACLGAVGRSWIGC